MKNNNIEGLVKKYILWPELENDFQKNVDFSKMSLKEFRTITNSFSKNKVSIEEQIALFYLANEKLSKTRLDSQGVLGKEELKSFEFYQKVMNELSKQLLAYILVISIVEARHNKSLSKLKWSFNDHLYKEASNQNNQLHHFNSYEEKFKYILAQPKGEKFLESYFKPHIKKIKGKDNFPKFFYINLQIIDKVTDKFSQYSRNTGYKKVATEFLSKNLADYNIGETLDYLTKIFEMNEFEYGFGGKPWSNISKHGLDFVTGKINAEVFIDQAFSLEHNGGNIFNKDYLFKHSYEQSYYINNNHIDISVKDLILNSQHLGILNSLMSIDKEFKEFKKINRENLYQELTKNNIISINQDEFNKQYECINSMYVKLKNQTAEIVKKVKLLSPEILKEDNEPFDMQKLVVEIVERENWYNKKQVKDSESPFFKILKYIQRNKVNTIKNRENKVEKLVEVYDINEITLEQMDKNIIGGKALSLANMTNLGLPVPKAKVFTTGCCDAYYNKNKSFKTFLNKQIKGFKTYLSDENDNPILYSVRSGAPISMPGMMDTVLNIGIDDSNYEYFCENLGKNVTNECIIKFMNLFCSSRLDIEKKFSSNVNTALKQFKKILEDNDIECDIKNKFPLIKERQIEESLYAVFDSWHSERAKVYRMEKGISDSLGTAAIVQQMVFGNLNEKSCTGVVFSRNCLTGEDKLVGEFLPKAQGEDVVSGSVTPFPIEQFKKFNIDAYEQLKEISKKLEKNTGQIQDIEFTVEDGKLYILQHRQAVCSPIASLKLLEDKTLNRSEILKVLEPKMLQESAIVETKETEFAIGLSANAGVLQGIVVRNEADLKKYDKIYKKHKLTNPDFGWIFSTQYTSPKHMPMMNVTDAFITREGGFTSHAAIISRSLNKPCIVGISKANVLESGEIITIDAEKGKIWKGLQPLVKDNSFAKKASKIILEEHKIDLNSFNQKDIENQINIINGKNKHWAFDFPNTQYVKTSPIKLEKFLSIGQRIALVLTADNKNKMKMK